MCPLFFQRLHRYPVELAAYQPMQRAAKALTWCNRDLFVDQSLHLRKALFETAKLQRRYTGEQLVEHGAQCIHVGAGIDVER